MSDAVGGRGIGCQKLRLGAVSQAREWLRSLSEMTARQLRVLAVRVVEGGRHHHLYLLKKQGANQEPGDPNESDDSWTSQQVSAGWAKVMQGP